MMGKEALTMAVKTVKPEGSQWTDDQWQAVAEKGNNILVAAAAGSGKTAVLVERIIRRIMDEDDPIDIDRLLIVTFTNAAAAEMRVRIGQALERELSVDPGSLRLRDQLTLLNKASITTLHSFCMSVVRRYYYRLDIDPAFRVIDDTESQLLREEVIEALFEEYYSSQDQAGFYELVDRYSNDRSDSELINLVQKIYDFSRSHPWPEQWLDQMAAAYNVRESSTIDDLPWTHDLKKSVQDQCRGLLSIIETAEDCASQPGGPYPYLDNFEKDKALLIQIIEASHGPWNALYEVFTNANFSKLKSVRGDDFDDSLKEQAKGYRDEVKKRVTQIKEELFSRPPESFLEDLHDMAPYISLLVELVKGFGNRYVALKKEKALVDFSDLEHDCLLILRDVAANPDEEISSEVAKQYRAQFEEILVDEYQDTNLVQETIIRHVSRGSNLFMVGDVKQSIYRFRLAEPGLFQSKYKSFGLEDKDDQDGIRIDLSENFRSREEILNGTNFIFQQIMDEEVGEIAYDERAALKYGATYYPDRECPTELHVIVRGDGPSDEELEEEIDVDEYQTAELEGHFIARKIKSLIESEYTVYDKSLGHNRPIQYRDIVILLRSGASWAPALLDCMKQHGIPGYTESSSGYFEAIEVAIMMSLLRTIDNPYQDIPLVSVLRSPIVGLTGAELARIRMAKRTGSYYEAMVHYVDTYRDELSSKLEEFTQSLEVWRDRARRGALSDLVWQIFRETGYYDYVAGLTGGEQRKANLKALYDRARQYEKTSFRGLFRFLRFIERLQDRGSDLGEARALSEQEDVVRVMTIHKSKGLEFPVVFVAGLNKKFNMRDTTSKTLLHKTLGFGTKNIDPIKRLSIPTLPYAAIKRKIVSETVAEEMRILYVALTRAREKLFLVGTIKDKEKTIQKWGNHAEERAWLLPAFGRSQSRTYLDWIGPSVLRHKTARVFHNIADVSPSFEGTWNHPAVWDIAVHHAKDHVGIPAVEEKTREREARLRAWLPVDVDEHLSQQVDSRLSWVYSHQEATKHMIKQTVTEIKRQQERFNEGFGDGLIKQFRRPIGDRPKFLSETESDLSAAEIGTAMHRMMQLIRLIKPMTLEFLQDECERLVETELMTYEEVEALDLKGILDFFDSEIGQNILSAKRVVRELPFSLALNSDEAYGHWVEEEEQVLVQGVIDCLYETEDGRLSLLDYKTDTIKGKFATVEEAKEVIINRYQKQLDLYATAIERIWKREIHEMGLYLFDGGHYFKVN
jgi:ATP-dependent helicase/nuclease subunit A